MAESSSFIFSRAGLLDIGFSCNCCAVARKLSLPGLLGQHPRSLLPWKLEGLLGEEEKGRGQSAARVGKYPVGTNSFQHAGHFLSKDAQQPGPTHGEAGAQFP